MSRTVRGRAPRTLGVGFLALLCLLTCASVAEAQLVFKRPSGSAIHFNGQPRAWCGPWAEDVARPSFHVGLRSARRGWELSAVRRDVQIGRSIEFPNDFVWNKPHGAQLFAFDAPIEASTAEEESSGSMVFSHLSCRLGSVVEFSVEAVLGSELFEGTPVQVSGTYRGHVSRGPLLPVAS